MTRALRLQVFAVEPDAVQLTWAALAPCPVTVRAIRADGVVDAEVRHEADGGAGAVVLGGLTPGTAYTLAVGDLRLRARTPLPPPGRELFRFMTLSDLHLGQDHFGLLERMREPGADEVHTLRGARAALAEGLEWGARHLVLKGDLVNRGTAEEYELLDKVLVEAGLPTDAVPGNHEVKPYREVDHRDAFTRLGLTVTDGVRAQDLPGLRLVMVDSTRADHNRPFLEHAIDPMAEAIAGRPALVVLHHHLLTIPFSTYWPPGTPSPLANRFIASVAAAGPASVIASGHSHRHRMRRVDHVVVTETGSPKDHPGTWTGYVVHEGGIRQVVRRVGRPDVIRWTERSRRAAGGAWGIWSPGTLAARCWDLRWPTAG